MVFPTLPIFGDQRTLVVDKNQPFRQAFAQIISLKLNERRNTDIK